MHHILNAFIFKNILPQNARARITTYFTDHAIADLVSLIIGIALPWLFDYFGHGMQSLSRQNIEVAEKQYIGGLSIIFVITIIQLAANIIIPKETGITRQSMPALIATFGLTLQALGVSFFHNGNYHNPVLHVFYGAIVATAILLLRIAYIDPTNKPEMKPEDKILSILALATLATLPMITILSLIYTLNA